MRVHNKVAVVTGGASGIGAAAAALLAAEGAHVATIDVSPEATHTLDVTDAEAVAAVMDAIANQYGRIDILFNSAGIAIRHTVTEQDPADWDRCMAVNVKGSYLCSGRAIPYMPSGSSIVHTASVVGISGVRDRSAYSASKGAIVALTRNMALDYAAQGIRVNCICPGFVETPFIGAILADPQRAARLTALHPLGRLGKPEDIARLVLFLASDESSWMTGTVIPIDGGFTAGHAQQI